MNRRGTRLTSGHDPGLSPCVCSTLRMATRAVTQLYDDVMRPSGLRVTQFSVLVTIARLGEANLRRLTDTLAIDQTTLTRSLNLLERDGLAEQVGHPDGRIKAMKLTVKGRRALARARPLWTQAQDKVLRALGTRAWADTQRRLAHVFHVAVKRGPGRGRRPLPSSHAPRSRNRVAGGGRRRRAPRLAARWAR
jgi:DNA-binding MarR family transcriptional regulator